MPLLFEGLACFLTHSKRPLGQKMGHKTKAPKGEITVNNCGGRIRLRWRHEGLRYSLNLPFAYQSENIHYATVKVAEIELDILKGCFDPPSLQNIITEADEQPSFLTPGDARFDIMECVYLGVD